MTVLILIQSEKFSNQYLAMNSPSFRKPAVRGRRPNRREEVRKLRARDTYLCICLGGKAELSSMACLQTLGSKPCRSPYPSLYGPGNTSKTAVRSMCFAVPWSFCSVPSLILTSCVTLSKALTIFEVPFLGNMETIASLGLGQVLRLAPGLARQNLQECGQAALLSVTVVLLAHCP